LELSEIDGHKIITDAAGNREQLKPVQINARCVKPQHDLRRHERSAFRRQLPTLMKVAEHTKEAILCGSGPSINEHLDEIKKLQKAGHLVVAIKGAHDWLIERGVIPDMALAVDPLPRIADLYRKPRYECIYFIASQCHPSVFDALEDHRVVVWNVHTKSAQTYWSDYFKRRKITDPLYFVGGGSTSGLRGISLLFMLGYRKLHMFGFDSCLRDDGLLKITGETNKGPEIVVVADGVPFKCDGAMSCQAGEFELQTKCMPGLWLKCYGDGLIPHISRQMARKGIPGHLLPEETFENLCSQERNTLPPDPVETDSAVHYRDQ
jgi:uncharacterized Rossmann fold enzyme